MLYRTLALLSLWLLSAACGDSGDDSVAGVAGDKNVRELSDEDLSDVCTALDATVLEDPDAVHGICIAAGVLAVADPPSFSVATCMERAQTCAAMKSSYSACRGSRLPGCSATVADLARCTRDQRAWVKSLDECEKPIAQLKERLFGARDQTPEFGPGPGCDRARTCF
jgi:hypothetical protein